MRKALLILFLFFGSAFSIPSYSYTTVLSCSGNCSVTVVVVTPPYQGGGGSQYPPNVTEEIPPIVPTGFAITVTTWLNDFTNMLVSFLITEEGPQKIIIGRVVFFLIIVAIVLMSLGTFFGYKKVRKYLVRKK